MTMILRRPEVESRTGLSRSSIYDGMTKGTFPQAVKLGVRAVGWREADISNWLNNLKHRNEV
ncbi:AlpA family transcriptional regulator [Falsochrobactrum ovis]|uniref:AlpA family transcriptional regulator n=1 Tax=Falsochrobactrum ovis TaxID=1293442 RepID=A0A364JT38_9HYPH|nr:AlpA family transcriptional regulator [Falsochrobactrum ovis]RAK26797.1 AlpA family transcriptional regulator [Falsochrobactrum ovis]